MTEILKSTVVITKKYQKMLFKLFLGHDVPICTFSPPLHLTLNHQSHMKPSWSKTVPFGQRKVCEARTAPLSAVEEMQMWKDWQPASRSA